MTNSNSFTPVINVSFFISNFFSFSIFSSDVPSISIKSISFLMKFHPNTSFDSLLVVTGKLYFSLRIRLNISY